MAIVVYNTLTRRKEEFVTRDPGKVAMYLCGINTYDYCHMGHARSFIVYDMIRRYLEFSGYEVTFVTNFTDIEDNILERARENNEDWRAMGERFIAAYFEDIDALNVKRATHYPRATEYIPQMIELIQQLIDRGLAYPVEGDVYFEVSKFPGYGKLSGRKLEDMMPGSRVEVDERLRDPRDFALWKSAKPGEPTWDSPWGPGRPGWHIECSAMSIALLGFGFDLHGGATELVFPHHEDEIAQSEGALGREPFVRYWPHMGWLTVNREKMSKSLGNFFTVREVLARYDADTIRMFLISVHYRSPLDFSDAALDEAASALERIRICRDHLDRLAAVGPVEDGADLAELAEAAGRAEGEFRTAMDDDFNTPRAIAALHELVSEVNRATAGADFRASPAGQEALGTARKTLVGLARALGLLEREPAAGAGLEAELVGLLIELRQMARDRKLYDLADVVRQRLGELGVVLEDRASETTWRRR